VEAYVHYLEERDRLRRAQEGALRRPGQGLLSAKSQEQAARLLRGLGPAEADSWVSVNQKLTSRMVAQV
jgi:hypothetical protein